VEKDAERWKHTGKTGGIPNQGLGRQRGMPQEVIIAVRKIYGNHRVQIPVEICETLNVDDGDRVAFVRDAWGEFYIRKANTAGIQKKERKYTPTRS